jgi:hypothetical protein
MTSLFARYYQAHEGRWRGRFRCSISAPDAFRDSEIPSIDRMRIRSMVMASDAGTVLMETRVDCAILGGGRVLHETKLSVAGFPLLWGREWLTPEEDGRSGTMRIEHRFSPFGGGAWEDGRVTIDDDCAGATYDLPWIGGRLRQRTRIVPEGLSLEQDGPFFHGDVVLVRLRESN